MNSKQTERLKRDPDFQTFMVEVLRERDRLNQVTDISNAIPAQDVSIDVSARRHAIKTIDKIFEPFIFEDVSEKVRDVESKYGLV
jgi:hypothetical protein